MTWTSVRDIAGDRAVAILPTGAIEAHGPHLPLDTDIVIAEAMARRGAERLAALGYEALILPPLAYTPTPYAAAFPGTLHVPPAATSEIVASVARSLGNHGIRMLVIANAHHDPAHVDALHAAVAAAARHGSAAIVFPDLTRRKWAEQLTDEFRQGCHAGRYEGSIVLAERPEAVLAEVMASLAANPRSLVDAVRSGLLTFDQAGGPLAYFGAPAEATAEEGREIVERLGRILEQAVVDAAATVATP